MGWQFTPYTVPLLVSGALAFVLAGYTVYVYSTDRAERSFVALAVTMAAIGVWSFAHAAQLSSTTAGGKFLWLKLLHFAPLTIPASFLVFVLLYTGNDRRITPVTVGLLAVEPLVTLAIVWSNPMEGGLMWTDVGLDTAGGFVVLGRTLGPWYLVNVVYSYVLLTTGFVVLVRAALASATVYRGQIVAMLVAAGVPFVTHVSFVLGLVGLNLTSLAFGVTGLALSYAIFRYRFLDIVPVARDTVIENMRDGYVVVDPEGRVVDLNPAAGEVVGRDDEEEVVGREAAAVLPDGEAVIPEDGPDGDGDGATPAESGSAGDGAVDGDDGSRHADGDAATAGTDDPAGNATGQGADSPATPDRGRHHGEVVVENGDQRYLEVDVTPLSEEERYIGRLVTLRDVTGRRKVEKRYQALIEHASDLITVIDRDGTVTYQSPSIERILDIPPEVVRGMDVFEYVHPEDERRLREEFDRGVDDPGYVARFEFRLLDADGGYRVFEGLARNLLDEPAVEGIVINARDITDRKERERELERQNERLEEFASVVSHDLRNPLSVARGHLEMVDDDAGEHVDQARRSLDRMESIIEDVLTLARQGEAVGETLQVDLESLAREAWRNVETPEADLAVGGGRELEADPDRLLSLLENLFRNAVEHAGPAVEVTVGTTDDGFFVADDGSGIDPEERETVFESGYTTADEGTGFGLAIVQRVAEAHGWEVEVTESESGGARFDVRGVNEVMLEDPVE